MPSGFCKAYAKWSDILGPIRMKSPAVQQDNGSPGSAGLGCHLDGRKCFAVGKKGDNLTIKEIGFDLFNQSAFPITIAAVTWEGRES